MHPALSVIFFTTLSGAGYGLLVWAGLGALLLDMPARPPLFAIVLALVLSTIGLFSSLLHLGKPGRAWRAFSQWRTSWLSREGIASLATFFVAVLLAAALLPNMLDASLRGAWPRFSIGGAFVALATMLLAIATVHCTAMIYASLKPIPAWRHRLVPVVYHVCAALTGGLLFCALSGLIGHDVGNMPALAAIVVAVVLFVLKWKYWRDIDRPLGATRGDAVGLPQRTATVFERPHTEANYLTREMGFVVARRHAKALRVLAVVLVALLPMLLMFPVWAFVHLDTAPWYTAAALSALAGTFVERWLFFAEAKHLVTLYY